MQGLGKLQPPDKVTMGKKFHKGISQAALDNKAIKTAPIPPEPSLTQSFNGG